MPKKISLKVYYGEYTDDVVFKKGVGYMTQKQEKEQREAEKARRMENRANLAAQSAASAMPQGTPQSSAVPVGGIPTVPLPTTTHTPGDGSVTPPSWWIGQAYSNPNEQQAFANAANAILPTLSPEDQRTMASYLATNFKDVFGNYANAAFTPIPMKLSNERNEYLNPQRAQAAMSILERVKTAAGGGSTGPGYD